MIRSQFTEYEPAHLLEPFLSGYLTALTGAPLPNIGEMSPQAISFIDGFHIGDNLAPMIRPFL
jgi:hypothetical protein